MREIYKLLNAKGADLEESYIKIKRMNLQAIAEDQSSDLECPLCHTNLPYIPETVTRNSGIYLCILCDEYFNKEREKNINKKL